MEIVMLFISLIVILIAAELFVNAIEWLGKLLNLSEGAVGSVLAAVGTALPETLIPIIALVSGNHESAEEIGIGAILGAPLMLSTLTMFVTGVAVIAFKHKRKHKDKVVVHYNTVSRDLKFFIFAFAIALLCGFIPSEFRSVKICLGVLLVLSYFIYVIKIVKENRENESDVPDLYFAFGHNNIMQNKKAIILVLFQAAIALTLIIMGAEVFVDSISYVSKLLHIPAFILAIIITPIATELPEKFNSVIWISREKDTLALGNITGAMMFQASILPAIGILLTDWTLNSSGTIISSLIAIASATILLAELNLKKHMTVKMLLFCGLFYFLFILLVCTGIIR
ncbi:MAG: sodium:calcium antiporter [Bacilli bacterium]|nr:sodium:calcium antiporter [Bacilli bacterium]